MVPAEANIITGNISIIGLIRPPDFAIQMMEPNTPTTMTSGISFGSSGCDS